MAGVGNFADSSSWVWVMEPTTVLNYKKMENNLSLPVRSEDNTLYIKSSTYQNLILLEPLLYSPTFLQSKRWLERKDCFIRSIVPVTSETDIFHTVRLQYKIDEVELNFIFSNEESSGEWGRRKTTFVCLWWMSCFSIHPFILSLPQSCAVRIVIPF